MKKYVCALMLAVGFVHADINADFATAVEENRVERVQELIKLGANVNTPISHTVTKGDCDWPVKSPALIFAIKENRLSMVKVLAKETKDLSEALGLAIVEGRAQIVDELIAAGADINHVDGDQNTPLIKAVKNARPTAEFSSQAQHQHLSRWQQRRAIINSLINKGADVCHANNEGRTALMEAVLKTDLGTVEKLLQVSAMHEASFLGLGTKPINYADKEGNTALILAVAHVRTKYINNQEYNICVNSQKILKALIETADIDPDSVNKRGESARKLLEELNKKHNG